MRPVLLASAMLLGCVSRLIVDPDGSAEGGQESGDAPDDDSDPSATDGSQRPDLREGCDVESHDEDCDGDGIPDGDDPLPEDPTGPVPARTDVIYVHSGGALYTFDPATLAIDRVASFSIDGQPGAQVLDIAIDRFGILYAVSFSGVFVCDPNTAACTTLASVSSNSLGLVPAGVLDAADDVLVSVAGSTLTQIRLHGPDVEVVEIASVSPYASSGDVATLPDLTTVFTSTSPSGTDVLVAIDPATGAVLGELGPVAGSIDTWGLATFEGALWAADAQGSILRRDPATLAWIWIATLGDQGWGAAAHPDAAD